MRLVLAAGALLVIFLAAYLPDLGHGFLKDDFRWIHSGRVERLDQLVDLFTTNVGFYRPLVSVSFAADHAVWGLNAFGYGLTNLLLALANAGLLAALARRLGLARGAALVAAAVWALNVHGVNMSILWLSGRTSLLALLFALGTTLGLLRGRGLVAGLLCLAALLSKEEVVLLPALLTAFVWMDAPREGARWRHAASLVWPMWVALGAYGVLRAPSGAFGPADAPSFYRFTTDPGLLLRNVFEYADRGGTVAVAVMLVLIGVVRFGAGPATAGAGPRLTEQERRALRLAALWIPAMYAVTVFLPVRSSLYALAPSAGTALLAGVVASRALSLNPGRFRQAAVAMIVVAAMLHPIYRSRNQRWVEPADLSARVVETIAASTASFPGAGSLVLVDAPDRDVNLDDVFGGLVSDAMALVAGPAWTGSILAPGGTIPPETTIAFELRDGALEPVAVSRRPAVEP